MEGEGEGVDTRLNLLDIDPIFDVILLYKIVVHIYLFILFIDIDNLSNN